MREGGLVPFPEFKPQLVSHLSKLKRELQRSSGDS